MSQPNKLFDVAIVGAGAAGLFCAAHLGQSGLSVVVIDNGKKPGRKILMSGGGRCNFSNLFIEPNAYISKNSHFCKSALARFTQWDFIELVNKYNVSYHEKTLGQLFCNDSAADIVNLLLKECDKGQVNFLMQNEVSDLECVDNLFLLHASQQVKAKSVVIATGGLSMPGLGATSFGYKVAQKHGIAVIPTRAGLVPLTLHKPLLDVLGQLSGISLPVIVSTEQGVSFKESLLFTHRGLSGPVILQISNYWQPGESIYINLLPDSDLSLFWQEECQRSPNQNIKNILSKLLPKRLIECFQQLGLIPDKVLKQFNSQELQNLGVLLQNWAVQPNGTEGYRTAEVTLGGIDTRELSSKTMESQKVPGLYFIGEAIDVTGWLGGYNFQWAWSSARACSQSIIEKLQNM